MAQNQTVCTMCQQVALVSVWSYSSSALFCVSFASLLEEDWSKVNSEERVVEELEV